MTHDTLCPSLLDAGLPDKFGMMERASCRCDLIARVREDMAAKYLIADREHYAAGLRDAVEAVKALAPMLNVAKWEGGYDCCGCSTLDKLHDDSVAAIEALNCTHTHSSEDESEGLQ